MKKLTVVLIMACCISVITASAQSKTTIKLAHPYNPDHVWDQGAHLAADKIKEMTGGDLEVQIFPASQLGTEEQTTEQVIFGTIDMAVSGAGQIGNMFKPILVAEMPYTFESNDHVLRFAKSEVAQEMFADMESQFNLKVVGTSSFGIRQLTANKEINTPSDLKGFKLRVPEQMITVEYGKAMGADPTPIAYAEAYMALQQGVVDGLENPLSAIQNMKFYEVQKFINLTSHVTNVCFFLMNGSKFNTLSPEYQKIVLDAFEEASQFIIKELNKGDNELVSFYEKEGLTVNKVDVASFQKATAGMPAKFSKWWIKYGKDLHKNIQGM